MNTITVLHFTVTGTFHCSGLEDNREVRIGGRPDPAAVGCQQCPSFSKCGMSHTSQLATQIKDIDAIIAACAELGLPHPQHETVKLYDGAEHAGITVRLPGWKFPVVIDTKSGQLHYDNYNGAWGNEKELNRLKQVYGVTKATLIARQKGYLVHRSLLPNGTIKLSVSGM